MVLILRKQWKLIDIYYLFFLQNIISRGVMNSLLLTSLKPTLHFPGTRKTRVDHVFFFFLSLATFSSLVSLGFPLLAFRKCFDWTLCSVCSLHCCPIMHDYVLSTLLLVFFPFYSSTAAPDKCTKNNKQTYIYGGLGYMRHSRFL